jgi:hypothetical protein
MPNNIPKASDVERLEEIKNKIKNLAQEAMEIVRGTSEYERARAYWYGHLVMSLDDDHMYVGHNTNMEDTIEALRSQVEDEDEEELEDDEE